MKNLTKLTLIITLLILGCNSGFAQKLGIINTQELLSIMPERDSASVKYQKYELDVRNNLESIQVEFNNKYQDFQKNMTTLSQSSIDLKRKELADLQTRFEEYQTQAQEEAQEMQATLMQPVITKAQTAIQTVSKANSFTMVFDISSGAIPYFDEASVINILEMVKTELGIKSK